MPTDTPRTVPLRPSDIPVRAKLLWDGALASGVLTPISTRLEVVEQAGVRFQVRVLEGPFPKAQAGRRQRARAQRGEEADPFGPCEPSLLLGDLGPSHCCVLNKFPALAHHLLIVTRAFEDQERLLTVADLEALWIALAGVDGFAFYNGGKVAGASQRHKHLQLVPLPMAQGEPPLPMEARIGQADFRGGVGRVAGLPFVHAIARLSDGLWSDPRRAAIASLGTYHRLLEAVGLPRRPGLRRQAGPYNLLVTRSWMMLVPRERERERERWRGTSINALGFAGSLLARDEAELEWIRTVGPMRMLREVGKGVGCGEPRGPKDPGVVE